MGEQYRVLAEGLSYEKRVNPGDVVDDLPEASIPWLLDQHHIEPADPNQAPAQPAGPAVTDAAGNPVDVSVGQGAPPATDSNGTPIPPNQPSVAPAPATAAAPVAPVPATEPAPPGQGPLPPGATTEHPADVPHDNVPPEAGAPQGEVNVAGQQPPAQ